MKEVALRVLARHAHNNKRPSRLREFDVQNSSYAFRRMATIRTCFQRRGYLEGEVRTLQ